MVEMIPLIDLVGKPISGEWGDGEGDIKVLRTTNFTNEGCLRLNDVVTRRVDSKKVEKKKLIKGDIIIEKSGGSPSQPVGRVVYFEEDGIYLCNNFTSVLRVKNVRVFSKYLHYILFSAHKGGVTQAFQNKTTGIINLKLNNYLEDIKIPLPPLATQKKIAAILDAADAHRQKTKQLLAKYDELAQSIFLEMFGDPVTNPKGWGVKRLEDCTTKIGSGATPRGGKDAYHEEGISLIRSLNIHDNEFKMKNLAYIDEDQADDLKNVIVEKADVLFNITGASVCRCCIVPDEILPARVNQHVSILRPDESIDSEFLVYFMTSNNQKQKLYELATKGGATREAITKQDLNDMRILVPDITLQQKFSAVLTNIRKQVVNTRSEIIDSENLFNSLLQKAFKGELVS